LVEQELIMTNSSSLEAQMNNPTTENLERLHAAGKAPDSFHRGSTERRE